MLYKRTHMCGELRLADEGKNVVLNGWVAKARSLGGLVFVDIRDKTGITQVTFNEDAPAEVIEKGIAHKFAAKEKLIAPNVEAFRMGLEIGKQQKAE